MNVSNAHQTHFLAVVLALLAMCPPAFGQVQTGNQANNEAAPTTSAEGVNVTRLMPGNAALVFAMHDPWLRRTAVYAQSVDNSNPLSATVSAPQRITWAPRDAAKRFRATSEVDAVQGYGPWENFTAADSADTDVVLGSPALAMTATSNAMRDKSAPAGFLVSLASLNTYREQWNGRWRRTGWNGSLGQIPRAEWWMARPTDTTVQGVRSMTSPTLNACTTVGCKISASHLFVPLVNGNAPQANAWPVYSAFSRTDSRDSDPRRATALFNASAAIGHDLWAAPSAGYARAVAAQGQIPNTTTLDTSVWNIFFGRQRFGSGANENGQGTGITLIEKTVKAGVSSTGVDSALFGTGASPTSPFASNVGFHQQMEALIGWTSGDAQFRSSLSR